MEKKNPYSVAMTEKPFTRALCSLWQTNNQPAPAKSWLLQFRTTDEVSWLVVLIVLVRVLFKTLMIWTRDWVLPRLLSPSFTAYQGDLRNDKGLRRIFLYPLCLNTMRSAKNTTITPYLG